MKTNRIMENSGKIAIIAMISIRVRGPKDTQTITFNPQSTSFQQLKVIIREKFNLQKEFDLLGGGFPPKLLELDDEDLLEGHLSVNDSLRIQLKELSGQQAVGIPKQTTKKAAATKKAASTTAAPLVPFGARVASLNPPKPKPNRQKASASSSTPRTRRVSVKDAASSEADISEHLLEAVQIGSTGKRNKTLRKVFKQAVYHQYDSSKAISRLQAIYSGNYTIKENHSAHYLGTGKASQIDIKFHRGIGSRNSYYEETVDLLSD